MEARTSITIPHQHLFDLYLYQQISKSSEQRVKQTPQKLLVKREVSASHLHRKPM